ncbi:Hypothetical protein PFREUD_03660 [Propionibacterium freudenreichii subsp. shermanii CIRM-BIA1]|uniref:Uncharacterized protein n=1 Tax=Propionibacterium freudenreichii subsp. shermanii (strain ATCC 9614 / DSM 4902 / CIP 103027 / NCIMB 8099 / CIRM-BIA1) TaxID=754252 RepID=D7GIH8_PROFC|nr:Hypothetical protein PFREUD_03660 [Propionibacterium freudenreichii subsp. shermanii CIRM-BIA1]
MSLNEGPLQKEGQFKTEPDHMRTVAASMKGPSRRRGNLSSKFSSHRRKPSLNEGPLQKEGQSYY